MRAGFEVVPMELDGQVIEMVLPLDPEDTGDGAAPGWLREGIARRRIMIETGRCPCGSTLELDDAFAVATLRAQGRTEATMCLRARHAPGCEATHPVVQKLIHDAMSFVLVEKIKKEARRRAAELS